MTSADDPIDSANARESRDFPIPASPRRVSRCGVFVRAADEYAARMRVSSGALPTMGTSRRRSKGCPPATTSKTRHASGESAGFNSATPRTSGWVVGPTSTSPSEAAC